MMTATHQGDCADQIREIRRWAEGLEGMVTFTLTPGPDGQKTLSLTPIKSNGAAKVKVLMRQASFDVHAGEHFHHSHRYCARVAAIDYCKAVVEGNLTETSFVKNDREVGWKSELRLHGRILQTNSETGEERPRDLKWIPRFWQARREVKTYSPY